MRYGRLVADSYKPARNRELLPGRFPAFRVRTSCAKRARWLIDEVKASNKKTIHRALQMPRLKTPCET